MSARNKTAVWGAYGFIGSRLMHPNRMAVGRGDALRQAGANLDSCDQIIWSAGWAGKKNVDEVQGDEARSRRANVEEPLELAARCQVEGRRLLIFSSGCLFDRLNPQGQPWREDEVPQFIQPVYQRHKWELEQRLQPFGDLVTIFRFRLPFDGTAHPRNLTHKFARFPAVLDQTQSFTWISDLQRAVNLWECGKINGGLWHVVQPGTMNNYLAVKMHLNPGVQLATNLPWACPRSVAILDSSKLARMMYLTPVHTAWQQACAEYKKAQATPT